MPNGMVWLDAETCKQLWALVPPPTEYPMVVWVTHILPKPFLYMNDHDDDRDDGDIPAVDAVTALRALEDADRIEWWRGLNGGKTWNASPHGKSSHGDYYSPVRVDTIHRDTPEALLLAVLDALEGK